MLFIPFFVFAGVIEDKIYAIYKKAYPTLQINKITLKNDIPTNITSINTSNINIKKSSGVIRVNNKYLFYDIDGDISVLKTTSSINKGAILSASNITLSTIKFKNFYDTPLTSVHNKSSKFYIPQGKIIYNYMLTSPNLVLRNSPITIVSNSGEIEITFQAIALQNGRCGDSIRVKKDKKIFNVTIDKNGQGRLWKF